MQINQETAEKIHAELIRAGQLLKQGKRPEAKQICLSQYHLCPEYPDTNQLLGLIYLQDLDFHKAAGHFRKALEIFDQQPFVWVRLGEALIEIRKPEEAGEAFQKALEIAPDYAEAHTRLGQIHLAFNRINEAFETFSKAYQLDPNQRQNSLFLARTCPEGKIGYVLDAFRKELADQSEMSVFARAEKIMAIGVCLKKAGNQIEALDYFCAGKALLRQPQDPWHRVFSATVEKIKRVFAETANIKTCKKTPHFRPIFIVGVPRSGSTLLEEIIASHSQVYGIGESRFSEALFQELEQMANSQEFPENLLDLSEENMATLAKHYSENIKKLAPDKTVFVDKMLSNFHVLGFLATLFPNARFLNINRNPDDTALSVINNIFTLKTAPYLASPSDFGAYFNLYENLMAFWKSKFQRQILDVKYEDLVATPEKVAKTVLGFCGLEFEDGCLEFHATNRAVFTPSSEKVRKKIFKSSVGKSEGAEITLAPFRQAFSKATPDGQSFANEFHKKAQQALEKKDREKAIFLLKKALAFNPGQPRIWVSLGAVFAAMAKSEEAKHAFHMALVYEPGLAEALSSLASLAREKGR